MTGWAVMATLVGVASCGGSGSGAALAGPPLDSAVAQGGDADSSATGAEATSESGGMGESGGSGAGLDAAAEGGRGAADGGAVACGATVCSGSQACVYVAGGPADCTPTDDAGNCAAGLTYMGTCPNLSNEPGCANTTLQAVSCVTLPASCGAAPSCACLPANACPAGTTCASVGPDSLVCGAQ